MEASVSYSPKDAGGKGFFILEHVPTGRLYTGVSLDMRKSIADLLEECASRKCKNRILQDLYDKEPKFKVYMHPSNKDAAVKAHRAFLVSKTNCSYLMMN